MEVSGWWYRQEKTPKLKGLTDKQRVEWSQEDQVGGWDDRRANLKDLRLPAESSEDELLIDEFIPENLTPHKFLHNYVLPQRPVVVRGVTSNWIMAENWRKKTFMKRYGSEKFNVTNVDGAVTELTAKDFTKQTLDANGGKPKKKHAKGPLAMPSVEPMLIHSREAARRDSRQFLKSLEAIPGFQGWVDDMNQNGSAMYLPQAMDFTLGPGWSGLPPHVDDHSWSALAFGARRYALWPPGAANGEMKLTRTAGAEGSVGAGADWLGDVLPTMMNVDGQTGVPPAEGNAVPFLVTVEAGDVLYVPSGWIRGWVNLQESVGIAEVFRPNLSEERAYALIADPNGHTLNDDMALIDG